LASEGSEQDTIRGVQIRETVCVYVAYMDIHEA